MIQWQPRALPFPALRRHRHQQYHLFPQATVNCTAIACISAAGMQRTSALEQPHVERSLFPIRYLVLYGLLRPDTGVNTVQCVWIYAVALVPMLPNAPPTPSSA